MTDEGMVIRQQAGLCGIKSLYTLQQDQGENAG